MEIAVVAVSQGISDDFDLIDAGFVDVTVSAVSYCSTNEKSFKMPHDEYLLWLSRRVQQLTISFLIMDEFFDQVEELLPKATNQF